MIFITFLTAIALSAVAAYYSVIGLASIFPGSFWPVVLMGAVLEASKLVTVSWLYRNWTQTPILMKTYMSMAVSILMLITSMGIFGYLSKAHMEHSVISAPVVDKIALYDEQIKTLKDNIDASRKELKQFDEIVDQTISRSTDEKGMAKAQAIRRSQQKERSRILQEIGDQQKRLASIKEEYLPLSAELKKVEADVGPIKYIAALVYGTEANADIIDKAVRLVILLIIVVFDPLAILLLIGANISMQTKHKVEFVKEEPITPAEPTGFVAQDIQSVLPDAITSTEQADAYITQDDLNRMMIKSIQELEDKKTHAYLNQPFKHFGNLKPMVAPKEEVQEPETKTVKIHKDNLILLDEITGETMPPLTSPGVEVKTKVTKSKKLEPKYDYNDEFAFREKGKK